MQRIDEVLELRSCKPMCNMSNLDIMILTKLISSTISSSFSVACSFDEVAWCPLRKATKALDSSFVEDPTEIGHSFKIMVATMLELR